MYILNILHPKNLWKNEIFANFTLREEKSHNNRSQVEHKLQPHSDGLAHSEKNKEKKRQHQPQHQQKQKIQIAK